MSDAQPNPRAAKGRGSGDSKGGSGVSGGSKVGDNPPATVTPGGAANLLDGERVVHSERIGRLVRCFDAAPICIADRFDPSSAPDASMHIRKLPEGGGAKRDTALAGFASSAASS